MRPDELGDVLAARTARRERHAAGVREIEAAMSNAANARPAWHTWVQWFAVAGCAALLLAAALTA